MKVFLGRNPVFSAAALWLVVLAVPFVAQAAFPAEGVSEDAWSAITPQMVVLPAHETVKIAASDGLAGDAFGSAVAADNDFIVVGAYASASITGAAYVFARNQVGADNWGQVKKLTASDGAANDRFGASVSISTDTVVVGAFIEGAAYVFSRNQGGADTWGQVQKLISSDSSWENFGFSIAVCGDSIVVGANEAASYTGAAYVFNRDQGGEDNWGLAQKLTASDGAASDKFGASVAVSVATLIAGTAGAASNSGAAYAFTSYDIAISTTTTLPSTSTTEPVATTTTEPAWCVDNDDDGSGIGPGCTGVQDCNDAAPGMHPEAQEICGDGIDNNCSGEADEDCEDKKCPAEKLLGQGSPSLARLRSFRDETLAASAFGRKIIACYYRHGSSIEAALGRSPALRALARGMLETAASRLDNKKDWR